jgi:hypothetical protein
VSTEGLHAYSLMAYVCGAGWAGGERGEKGGGRLWVRGQQCGGGGAGVGGQVGKDRGRKMADSVPQ